MTDLTEPDLSADDPALADEVYRRMRKLAGAYMANERAGHTLQPTELVHEAWMRLAEIDRSQWSSREHFLAMGARSMRRVLVDHARRRGREKRGGDWQKVTFDRDLLGGALANLASGLDVEQLLVLDQALTRLGESDQRAAEVVELRFFAGLSVSETATLLEVGTRTIEGDWAYAKAWLRRELTLQGGE